MKNLSALLGFLLYSGWLFAQQPAAPAGVVKGIVANEKEELLIGATVYWKGTKVGAVTDTSGRFSIAAQAKAATLVVHYIGYNPAEVEVLPGETNLWIEVVGTAELKTVTVSEREFGTSISTLGTRNIESISSKELRKAPCCNLSESFQTNGAIDVTYPNALTGVKEIQLLGLRGIYSQFLVENRPTMTGIATPFALEYIPGTWLHGIVLAKGASTVKNGYTGITGQVNADLVKPFQDKPLFLNAFGSSEGRGELNVHLNRKGKKYDSNGLLLHGSFVENRWDTNDDGFRDSPNRQQLNGLYRWYYEGPAGCAQINVQAVSDRRQGGQMRPFEAGQQLFAVNQDNDRVELWGKYGKEEIFGRPFMELGNMGSISWHRSGSTFGRYRYDATQQSVYWQTLLQTIIDNTNHTLVVAPSLQYDDIREVVLRHDERQEVMRRYDLSRRETAAGLMAEYTFSRPSLKMDIPDFVIVVGSRADWNSRFGWLVTPRMSAKYNFNENTILRISGGRGFRSPNLIAENISVLASNRTLEFGAGTQGGKGGLEEAWNYGVNFTQNFTLSRRKGSLSIDVYRTDFRHQMLVDVEQDVSRILFYGLAGKSFSNSVLAVMQYNLLPGLDLRFGYKWNDVRSTYATATPDEPALRRVPLVARHRGLAMLDYTTPNKRWTLNTYAQIIGPQRLPDNSQVPHYYIHDFPPTTPTFALWNLQITRHWQKLEVYTGCENITGFQQHHAIIASNEPWSPYFNGAQVWAPMMRQIAYLGVRYAPGGLADKS
ncbi:MAG TPA: TonB-dependent receptor [Saprospiraceae bacterium]|nr:TonB-dependent receptor [Saprospiraceae bacterium]